MSILRSLSKISLPNPLILLIYDYCDEFTIYETENSDDVNYNKWLDIAKKDLFSLSENILIFLQGIDKFKTMKEERMKENICENQNDLKCLEYQIGLFERIVCQLEEKAFDNKKIHMGIIQNPTSMYSKELIKKAIDNRK